jgi:hypothetical protein
MLATRLWKFWVCFMALFEEFIFLLGSPDGNGIGRDPVPAPGTKAKLPFLALV